MTLSDRIVLMQAGRIRQAGPPVQLYRQPRDAAVAAFFGSPNFLDATVTASRRDGDGFVAELECGGWRGASRCVQALQPGQAASLVVRPEDIQLLPAGEAAPAGDLALPARVVDTVFHGGRATVVLEAGQRRLKAEVAALRTPPVATAVTALLPTDALWCVERADA